MLYSIEAVILLSTVSLGIYILACLNATGGELRGYLSYLRKASLCKGKPESNMKLSSMFTEHTVVIGLLQKLVTNQIFLNTHGLI